MAERIARVPAISCGHCVKTIEREVGELEGVETVSGDAAARTVRVRWDEGRTDWAAISGLLREIDYPAED